MYCTRADVGASYIYTASYQSINQSIYGRAREKGKEKDLRKREREKGKGKKEKKKKKKGN